MKKILLTLGLAVGSLALNHANAQDCSGNRYKNDIFTEIDSVVNIKYGQNKKQDGATNEDLYLDVYFPKNDTDNERAVIMFAHGGSFTSGSRKDFRSLCINMAKKGYVTISISYRLLNITDPAVLVNIPLGFKKEVVRAIHDMRAAVRYIRNTASDGNPYGINPDLIIVGGGSAGAILANHVVYLDADNKVPSDLTSYMTAQGGLEGNSGTPGVSSIPQMSLSMCGAIMDTTWLEAGDQPYYGVHTKDDDVVQNLYGYPLQGNVAVNLYGDSLMYKRTLNVGINSQYKYYETGGHCEFGSDFYEDMMGFAYTQLCQEGLLNTTKIANKLYFSVYPNPVSSELTIEIPSNQWNANVEIIDMVGKTVYTSSISASQSILKVNTTNLRAGVYQVKVKTNDGRISVQKIVIE